MAKTQVDLTQEVQGVLPTANGGTGASSIPTWNQNTTGSAAKLTTARAINGVNFDGSAAITVHENAWQPTDYSWIAWTFDPVHIYTGGALVAGDLFLIAIPVRAATTITNVLLYITVAGATLTTNQNFAALYQGGSLLAATGDQHTNWTSIGLKTMALTSPQSVSAGLVYVGMYYNGTTAPQFGYGVGFGQDGMNLNSVNRVGIDSHTGLTTAAPSTLGSFTTNKTPFWAAVS